MSDFDKACLRFTVSCCMAAAWKDKFLGAAYSTRLMAALDFLKPEIAALEVALIADGRDLAPDPRDTELAQLRLENVRLLTKIDDLTTERLAAQERELDLTAEVARLRLAIRYAARRLISPGYVANCECEPCRKEAAFWAAVKEIGNE